jgi:hypothetical protein
VHQCEAAQSVRPEFVYLKLGPKTTFVNDILNRRGTMAIDIYQPSDYSAGIMEFLCAPRLCSLATSVGRQTEDHEAGARAFVEQGAPSS